MITASSKKDQSPEDFQHKFFRRVGVSIAMQISELVALSTAAFLHTDHPPFTNLQLNSSTLQFSIWGSCNLLFADLQKAQDITCAVAVTLNSKTSLNQLADVNIFKNIYFQ